MKEMPITSAILILKIEVSQGGYEASHVSGRGSPGSTALCELGRVFHPMLSPSCVAEDLRSRERFQPFLECHGPDLQLVSSSLSPRARSLIRSPSELVVARKLRQYTCKAEAAPQFYHWYAITCSLRDEPYIEHLILRRAIQTQERYFCATIGR